MFGLDIQAILYLLVILGFYFLPTIAAIIRKCKRDAAILVLNLLLGWTIIGWIGALIWALADNVKTEEIV